MTATLYTELEQQKKYTVGQAIRAAQTYLGEKGYGRDVIWEASSVLPHVKAQCDKHMKLTLEELNLLVEEMVDRTMIAHGHTPARLMGQKS